MTTRHVINEYVSTVEHKTSLPLLLANNTHTSYNNNNN